MCLVPFVTTAAHSSVTTIGSSCYPQGPVKAFLFCHFIGNGKAISYTRNIWRTWIWISTYSSNSQWQWDFHSSMRLYSTIFFTYTACDLTLISVTVRQIILKNFLKMLKLDKNNFIGTTFCQISFIVRLP